MKFLCFGSMNLDHTYLLGSFPQPGETAPALDYQTHAGGKGLNQAIALAKAGAEVYMSGCLGADGGMLLQTLQAAGVHTGLVRQADAPTGHAVIQVDRAGQNCIIVCPGANHTVTPWQVDEALSHFSPGDVLLLQNEINGMDYLARRGKQAGLILCLNPSPMAPELLELLPLTDLLLLNELEGEQITGASLPEEILDRLEARYPQCRIVLTLGPQGACFSAQGQRFRQEAFPVSAVDTTGAGDTFTGYFLETLFRTGQPQAALERSARAASVAVTRKGAAEAIPAADEVD